MTNTDLERAIWSLGCTVPGLSVFDVDPGQPDGRTVVTWSDTPPLRGPRWPEEARRALDALPSGGLLAGYIGYEAGRECERMPERSARSLLPEVHLRPTPGHVCHHADTGHWTTHGTEAFQRQARALLDRPHKAPPQVAGAPHRPLSGPADRYLDAVRSALGEIHDGEVYQVNLAWEARAPALPRPLATWLALRADNPARRGAFVQLDQARAVASNSPELFLELTRDAHGLRATSVPIKGTTRVADGHAGRHHLATSEKERAELTMIVDMVRNDLGRVARTGAVTAGPRILTVCGDLVHAEQAVHAHIRPGLDALDVVQAAFPPGSVTGAPKVRAMSLIHALEPVPRGVYTGAMGFFAADGTTHLNVAIRTLTCTPEHTSFHVGAGIVADSVPAAEWHETRAKGHRIHAVVSAALRP